MILRRQREPLQLVDVPMPRPKKSEVLIRIEACAVCRTDLHIVDGELEKPKLPLIPGHQIAGVIESSGERVGVPWLGWSDETCHYCTTSRENLCDRALFTGYTIDGGYAESTVADARYCFHLPERYDDVEVAPLLCAGLIGYRSYRKTGDARRLGIYGFGNAAHLIAQIAIYEGRELFVFTRPGDKSTQQSARKLRTTC